MLPIFMTALLIVILTALAGGTISGVVCDDSNNDDTKVAMTLITLVGYLLSLLALFYLWLVILGVVVI